LANTKGMGGFDFREDGKFSYFTFTANDTHIELRGSRQLAPDSDHIHIKLPEDVGGAHIDLGVSEESSTGFTFEIAALEDQLLKVRVLEELPADDARLARDANASVAFYRSLDVWPRQD
jgi:hypothetical protein